MSTLVPRDTDGLRESLLVQALEAIPGPAPALLPELIEAYLAPVPDSALAGIRPKALAETAAAHLRLGAERLPGENLLRVFTPQEWDARGSTIALFITDDRNFLVDTVVMELTRQEWSVRALYHPQPSVHREHDALVSLSGGDLEESWIAVEIYPPLGHSAAELSAALADGLRSSLETAAVIVEDFAPMVENCRRAAAELSAAADGEADAEAIALLEWLADGHFVFVAYADYRPETDGLRPLAGSQLGILREVNSLDRVNVPGPGETEPLVLVRDRRRSPVHRRAYLNHLAVRHFDAEGRLIREDRFLGLLAASAYNESVGRIPVLAAKADRLLGSCGFEPGSYGWNCLRQVIDTYPRDELFEASVEDLAPAMGEIAALRERRETRIFLRRSRYGGFVTALVYLPRDRYNTASRTRIQEILLERLGGVELEYSTLISASVLVRLFFVVRLGQDAPDQPDVARIQTDVAGAALSWEDEFIALAAHLPSEKRGIEFGESYPADYTPQEAYRDLLDINQLSDSPTDLRLRIDDSVIQFDPADLRMKVFTRQVMSLTQVMPHLSGLGVEVVDEVPYPLEVRGERVMVYDFGLRLASEIHWDAADRVRFAEAFAASWTGRCEDDQLNELVVAAELSWVQVSYLRAISRYLQQAGVPFSQPYIASAMVANPRIAAALVRTFEVKFDPDLPFSEDQRAANLAVAQAELVAELDQVASLDHDRILRAFLDLVTAAVRTNAFTGTDEVLAIKVLPKELELLPKPRPEFEVFTYSPRVLGVHLRFGAVARGGLRWSDRREDFRTEVLGLVKAQMVKNTVIVPVGAKGGFYPLQLPPATDRAGRQAEGRACYQLFVNALLSVTDNLVGSEVVPPDRVLRYDGDDPYLVVAADKGTATFSDLANAVAIRRGYWLGDAFASGGSSGYDHKVMGITAKGAWESVKRHFAEMGLDPQTEEFTCVGIGDMAGDVFGNGMLASDRMKLVAAFNHLHIFVDPQPDPARSFAERQRLFGLAGSTWADYAPELISAGGGVFRRDAKSIPISSAVSQALGLGEGITELTPNALISAILTAPVDLLFNGGVGTFVKAAGETHAAAGDKANDGLRVNGGQLRARCVGEGGNLGFTQLGRIEYALTGGRINTDFIDNSAGVDTSDHEVNIKILLAPQVASGALDETARRELLSSMTDEVGEHVLAHNFDQNLALANAVFRAEQLAGQDESWMRTLEGAGLLDRALEYLPSSSAMSDRIGAGRGLTRPELCTLLAYTKIALKTWVLASDLPDDPYLADRLVQYFPRPLRERFGAEMPEHRLAREIITTVAVNRFVNSQGMTAYHRLSTETGAAAPDIIRAQLASRAVFNVGLDEVRIRRAAGLPAELGTELRVTLLRMVERATRWILHHHQRGTFDIQAVVDEYGPAITALRPKLAGLLTGADAAAAGRHRQRWHDAGISPELAENLATAGQAHSLLGVVQVAHSRQLPPLRVAEVHYLLASELGLDLLFGGIDQLPKQVRWDAMARAALRDDLLASHTLLTERMVTQADRRAGAEEVVGSWLAAHPSAKARIAIIRQVSDGAPDVARMNVGLGQVRAMLAG